MTRKYDASLGLCLSLADEGTEAVRALSGQVLADVRYRRYVLPERQASSLYLSERRHAVSAEGS